MNITQLQKQIYQNVSEKGFHPEGENVKELIAKRLTRIAKNEV